MPFDQRLSGFGERTHMCREARDVTRASLARVHTLGDGFINLSDCRRERLLSRRRITGSDRVTHLTDKTAERRPDVAVAGSPLQ